MFIVYIQKKGSFGNSPIDVIFKIISDSICVSRIDKTAEINDIRVAETIDTKVSSATCFSFLLSLSILLTITAANPNSTVKTIEKTVVNNSAKSSLITKFNLFLHHYKCRYRSILLLFWQRRHYDQFFPFEHLVKSF